MRSLSAKLLLAFALIALLGVGTVAIATQQATVRQFTIYVSRGGQMRAQVWAQLVASYIARLPEPERDDPWGDLPEVLSAEQPVHGSGQGKGQSKGMGGAGQSGTLGFEERILIATPDQQIVFDTEDELVGQPIDDAILEQGAPIVVDQQTVGTLLVTSHDLSGYTVWERQFMDAVNQAVLWAALLVSVASLGAAVLFSRQLVAPLRRLTAAAERMARGDLGQRVAIPTADEVGELGAAFNRMAEDLEAAAAQRRQMTADIAHELRNPLSVIRGNLEAMLDGIYALDEEHLSPILEETMLLQRLVDDLRLLSLADAGQLTLIRTDVDVGALLNGVVSSASAVAQERGLALRVSVPQERLVLDGDAERLRQVLGNLVSNAVRYTPSGGTVTLSARRADGWVHVNVSDTGPGIAEHDLPHLFDRFYRAETARDRVSGGSGLGLAIARALIEAHHGAIRVQSGLGEGTTFTVSLPTQATQE